MDVRRRVGYNASWPRLGGLTEEIVFWYLQSTGGRREHFFEETIQGISVRSARRNGVLSVPRIEDDSFLKRRDKKAEGGR